LAGLARLQHAMSDSTFKVTDKRMFTPEGELREEHRSGGDAAASPAVAEVAGSETTSGTAAAAEPTPPPSPSLGLDSEVGFYDLVAAIAEPAALYLGEAALPDGTIVADLGLARAHIDLLAVLQAKTAGNLTREESAALEEVLYRLRMHYVQKRD
jgi:hypothetical protein